MLSIILNILSNFFLLFGSAQIIIPVVLIGLIFNERRFLTPTMLLLFTIILSSLLKLVFAVPYSPELVQKLGKDGFSFPSGHMQSSAIFYGWFLITIGNKWIRLCLMSVVIGIGFALIYEGYHNIYDVCGALFFAFFTIILYKNILPLIEKEFDKLPESLAGLALIFFLSMILVTILVVFYQIPPHLDVILCIILGINLALLIKNNFKEFCEKVMNIVLILIGLFVIASPLFVIDFNILFLQQIKWIFVVFAIPFLEILLRKLSFRYKFITNNK